MRQHKLRGNSEEFFDEGRLFDGVFLADPPHSTLPNHFYGFDSLQGPPSRIERAVPFRQPSSLLSKTGQTCSVVC
jgi:hypothetical protein